MEREGEGRRARLAETQRKSKRNGEEGRGTIGEKKGKTEEMT